MKAKKVFSFVFCFLFLSVIVLTAAPDDKFPDKRGIRENIHTLRLLRMTQALNLTEEQAAKIFPAINRIEKEKMEIHREIGLKVKELKLSLEKEDPEEQIENMIEDLKNLRNLLKSKDEEFENFMEENLTVVQRAKYILFSVDFFRALKEKVERARILQERLYKRR